MKEQFENKYFHREEEEVLNLKQLLVPYLVQWPWMLLSILIAGAAAHIFVSSKNHVYQSDARLLVRDVKQGGAEFTTLDVFSDLGFGNASRSVLNEMESLTSRNLIKEVVRELDLQEQLVMQSGFLETDINYFRNEPFHSSWSSIVKDTLSASVRLELNILDEEKIAVQEVLRGTKIDRGVVAWNQEFKTHKGSMFLMRSPEFKQKLIKGTSFVLSINSIDAAANAVIRALRGCETE
jgi:hypothetical protein